MVSSIQTSYESEGINTMEKIQLLRDPSVFPSDEVLAEAMRDTYPAYTKFKKRLPEYGIEAEEWRYYNDGKSWLSKNVHKKKTVFWLSVWDGFFKVTMFFTEKTCDGIFGLPIAQELKTFEKMGGKLKPLIINVNSGTDQDDLFKVIEYKRDLK